METTLDSIRNSKQNNLRVNLIKIMGKNSKKISYFNSKHYKNSNIDSKLAWKLNDEIQKSRRCKDFR